MGFVVPGRFTEVHPQKKSANGPSTFGPTTIVLMHQIRKKPDGSGKREMRSRFWFGHLVVAGMNLIGTDINQFAHDMATHCHVEMTHLGERLPAIFEEFKDDIW
jgi:DAPG hydrolase PhiG domain